ncbi:MAG: hypothetical protein N2235_26520, partial [Fischerella sp.]|nr:hypothetical protein [Fischerella sp.]
MAQIIVSFKPGKKVATYGKQMVRRNGKTIIVQNKVVVPRGPLNEESVYGKIRVLDTDENGRPIQHKPEYFFAHPHLIFKPYIRELVEKRLALYKGDYKKAVKSLQDHPIYLDPERTVKLKYATCYKEDYVIKYPLSQIRDKDVQY